MKRSFAIVLVCILLFMAGCAAQGAPQTTTTQPTQGTTTQPTHPSSTTQPTTTLTTVPTTQPVLDEETYNEQYRNQDIRFFEYSESIKRNDGKVIFEMTCPEIHLTEDHTAAQAAIVNDLKQHIGEFIDESHLNRDEAISYYDTYYQYERMFYYDILTYYVQRNDANVYSIHAVQEGFLGGVHGYHISHDYNYDPATGKLLTLNDILQPGAADDLCQLVCDAIASDPRGTWGNYVEKITNGYFSELEKTNNWCLTEEGICFTFDEYILADYASGAFSPVIPYESLTDILLPQYIS